MKRLQLQLAVLLFLPLLLGCGQDRREEVAERYSTGQKKEVRVYEGEGTEEELIKRQIYTREGELIRVENAAEEDTLYYSDLNPELLEPEGQKKFLGGKAWLVDKIGSVSAVQFTADSMYAVDMERGGNVEEAWIREVGYSIGEEREDPGGRVLLHGNAKTDTLVLDPMGPDSLLWVGAERLPFGLVSYLERVSRDVQKAARTYRKERRKELRQRRAAVSRKITLRPQGNQMEFEQDEFSVFAGKSVELIFENTATSISMQHNVLVLDAPPEQDIFMEVGQAAVEAGAYENYVPDHEAVVAATPIAKPGERVSVTFNAPEEPGTYGFVCTFPGHWATGQGTMQVVPE